MKRRAAIGILLTAALITINAHAEEPTGRLKRIKDTGTFVVAHGETAIPFSYIDKSGPIGFGVDISKRIAAAVKAHLGLSELRIRWNPVTLSTRFPLIVTNTVDLECIATTHTSAREEMVSFSNTFHISDDGFAVRRDSGIKDFAGLAGKRVAVVRGTTTEQAMQTKAAAINLTLVPERNNRLAMEALAEGRADAYVAAAPIIAGEFLRAPDAKPFVILDAGGYEEAFACMLPKGDTALKKVVDDTLAGMMASGEMERLYNKWFMSPIPPFGRNVNLPLNDDNRRLYQAPNDRPLQ